jgi:hypothetical protein
MVGDVAYGVQYDTGGFLTMGNGSVYSTSIKQKMMTRSSNESEVVVVYDVLPQILWTANFVQEQGYSVDTSVLYQDNKSAMLLETNVRQSSSKQTRHMNFCYFYIKDNIYSK